MANQKKVVFRLKENDSAPLQFQRHKNLRIQFIIENPQNQKIKHFHQTKRKQSIKKKRTENSTNQARCYVTIGLKSGSLL